jgi:uncharacterized protein (DUF488 family)
MPKIMPKKNSVNNFILTFGYGNRKNYDELITYLQKYQVNCIIDVREKPRAWSRKWYGEQIKKLCFEQGITYISEPVLGNLSGTNHWVSPDPEQAKQVLLKLADQLKSQTLLLLCAEMDYHKCHRTEVAINLQNLMQYPIEHLP